MPIYRYASKGVNVDEILRSVTGPLVLAADGPETFVDIDAPATSKDDLDETLARLGFFFVETNPLISPEETFEIALFGDTISPAAVGSTQNDYAPPGLSTADVVRQDVSAACSVTGLAAMSGRRILLANISTVAINVLTLTHEDVGSLAANRFQLPGGVSLAIGVGSAVSLWYDSVSARWRTAGW